MLSNGRTQIDEEIVKKAPWLLFYKSGFINSSYTSVAVARPSIEPGSMWHGDHIKILR